MSELRGSISIYLLILLLSILLDSTYQAGQFVRFVRIVSVSCTFHTLCRCYAFFVRFTFFCIKTLYLKIVGKKGSKAEKEIDDNINVEKDHVREKSVTKTSFGLKPVDQLGSSSKPKRGRGSMNITEQLKRIKNINPGNENKLGNRNVYI